MGVSGGTAESSRKERDDGGEIRHGSKRSDYWRLLEGVCEGRTRTPKSHEIFRFLSPCWEKKYVDKVFYGGNTIFEAFVPINLLLALYLVYPRYLFNMGPAYKFSRGAETFRIDGYLTLILLSHGELTTFHRLMKYEEPLSVPNYSYKCAAGLKTLLVEYLLMQNRHLTGEERRAKTREEQREANGGIPLLTDLYLAMRSDPLGMLRGLGQVETSVYGPAVAYAFPDRLNSVVHVSLISVLDGTALNWCRQEDLRARMSETVLFGKIKDPELIVLNFRGQLQFKMAGKQEDPIKVQPKFCNLNPVAKDTR